MQTWEIREKKTKRIALILSLVLHLAFFTALTFYSSSNSDSSFLEWTKSLFQKEQVEESNQQTAQNI